MMLMVSLQQACAIAYVHEGALIFTARGAACGAVDACACPPPSMICCQGWLYRALGSC